MQGISFTIQNPDSIPEANLPVIYTDKLEKSELTFSFTQDLGIPSLGPKDSFQVRFPQAALSAANTKMLVSKYWVVKSLQEPTTDTPYYTFLLQPAKTIPFADNTIDITFKGLPGKAQTMVDVSVTYKIGGAPVPAVNQNAKLHVTAYPDKDVTLSDNILFPSVRINANQDKLNNDTFYLSSAGLRPPIANEITLNLKFSGSQLVDNWDKQAPFFQISFSYGYDADDLTDAIAEGETGYNPLTTAYKIVASVGENDLWQVLPESGTDTTSWRIVPTASNHHLFTEENNNLDITFSHVISRLPAGNATIFVQWGHIPGYNPGWKARDIVKQSPKPEIFSFSSTDGNKTESIKYGAGVSLEWDVFAAPKVQLRCEEAPYLNQSFDCPRKGIVPALVYCGGVASKAPNAKNSCGSFIVKSLISHEPVSNFYLQALDKEGNHVGDEAGPVTITIDDYPTPAFKGALQVKEALPPFTTTTGTPTFYISLADTAFTLQWQVENPHVVETISIIGPTGRTVKIIEDPTETQLSISYREDGAYQITLNAKDSGHRITERFVVNQLFSAKKSFLADINTTIDLNVSLNKNFSKNFLHTDFSLNLSLIGKLMIDYQLNLHFQQNKTGALSLIVKNNQLKPQEGSANMDNIHFAYQVNFPQPSILLSKLVSHPFTWEMHPDGNIAIQFKEAAFSKSKWTLQLQKGSIPGHLAYQFVIEGGGGDILWSVPVIDPSKKTVLGNFTFSGDISAKGQTDFAVSPPLSQLQFGVLTSHFILK